MVSCGMRCGPFKAGLERNLQAAMWPWVCLGRAMYPCLLTPSCVRVRVRFLEKVKMDNWQAVFEYHIGKAIELILKGHV